MRIFSGVLLLTLSTFAGIVFSQKYTDRYCFYKSFYLFNVKLKNEIAYSKSSIKEIVKGEEENDFILLLKKFVFEGEKDLKIKYLDNDEIKFLKEYFSLIGKSDGNSQTKYLDNVEKILSDKTGVCEKEKDKNKTVYIKLGFLFGLILFVLVI